MVGQTVSHYRVIEQLGSGGMGVVYRAEDLRLGRMVALKFLPMELSRDEAAAGRFEREARTASSLNHPNICTIYAFDEFEGRRFIAMELLDGQPLNEVITRPLPIDKVIEYGVQIADALDAAHGQGVLHRDIKPANIFVTRRGQVKVLDFGLAKLSQAPAAGSDLKETIADSALSMHGMALGTVAYMSPEQARGEELDARSDLFSCGIVLYEMVTGQQAFQGRTSAIIFDSILNHPPPPPTLLKGDLPAELVRIIDKALDKNRDLRYQTASGLRSDLQRLRRDRDSGLGALASSPSGAHAARGPSSGAPVHGEESGITGPVAAPPASTQAPSQPVAPTPVTEPGPPAVHAASAAPSRRAVIRNSLVTLLVVILVLAAGVLVRRDLVPEKSGVRSPGAPDAAPQPDAAVSSGSAGAPGANGSPAGDGKSSVAPAPETAGRATGVSSASRTATARDKDAPKAAVPVAPAAETPAAPVDPGPTLLGVARAKVGAKLYDQALADLRSLVGAHPASSAAPAAYLLMGSIRELQTHPDEAMAAYVELRSRYGASDASAEGTVRLAQLILRSKRPDRVAAARDLLMEVPARHADSPWAPRALALQAALEDREKMKVRDPEIGKAVPASLATNRALTERYPTAFEAELGFWHLAEAYEDLKRYDLAAQALSDLAARFPNTRYDAWWRAAEMYDRRVKDKAAARAAYARVPVSSPNYKDAQKRLR